MKQRVLALTVLVGAAMTASAVAAPRGSVAPSAKAPRAKFVMGPDGPGVNENFDGYANGSGVIGQGPWVGWSGTVPPPEGFVTNAQSSSAPHSMRLRLGNGTTTSNTDAVIVHAITGGKWVYSAKTYAPSASTGTAYFILLNTYPAFAWSLDMGFNLTTGQVTTLEAGTTPQTLIRDQWVDIRVEIDLDALTQEIFYNNVSMGQITWGALNTLQALDLYSDSTDEFYYDNVKLEEVVDCYPDCNADGFLTAADFGCFQTQFVLGTPYADCNGDGVRTAPDFGCFQTKFVLGCP